jgi:hypothetical protein
MRLEDLINDAFAQVDDIHMVVMEENVFQDDIPNEDDNLEVNVDDMEETIWESTQPVWDGCVINRLQGRIIFMNMCNLYGVPNTFLDKFLTFLLADLMPWGESLTRTAYETKRMVMKMDLEHVPIHCCPDGHIFYEGQGNQDFTECSNCGFPWYVPGSNKVPVKVLW